MNTHRIFLRLPVFLLFFLGLLPHVPAQNIRYNDTLGNLAVENQAIQAGILKSSEDRQLDVAVRNIGDHPLRFLHHDTRLPSFLRLHFGKAELAPGEAGKLFIEWVAEEAQDAGLAHRQPFQKPIIFYTDEAAGRNRKHLTLKARYEQDLSGEQLAQAPRIRFEETEFDGGKIIAGEKLRHAYRFTNTGQSPLSVKRVKASCGCTVPSWAKEAIAPGESGTITAVFDSRNRHGAQHKTIRVQTNDPRNPNIILHLRAKVERDPFGGSGAPVNGGLGVR